jgi:hypothetical protein
MYSGGASPGTCACRGDVLRSGIGVRPEHDRRHLQLVERGKRLVDLMLALPVLGRHGMLAHQQEWFVERDVRACAFTLQPLGRTEFPSLCMIC